MCFRPQSVPGRHRATERSPLFRLVWVRMNPVSARFLLGLNTGNGNQRFLEPSKGAFEPHWRALKISAGGGDSRVAKEHLDVVQVGMRLEEPTGKLASQIVEMQA